MATFSCCRSSLVIRLVLGCTLLQNISRLVFTVLFFRSFLYFWIGWLKASFAYFVFGLQSMSTLIAMKLFHCSTMLVYDETFDDLRGTCMD